MAAGVPTFAEIYARWFHDVLHWLRALGAPEADREDIAQEVFLVARRRLATFDGGNLPGWLYRIAQLTTRHHRRRLWWRTKLLRRWSSDATTDVVDRRTPGSNLESKDAQRLLHDLVGRIAESRRATFLLFELEGYIGEDIARIQDIPVNTVWTRIHHARKDFLALVAELNAREAKGK